MATVLDIEILQGATFHRQTVYRDSLDNPIDLTGYQGRGQLRLTPKGILLADFVVTIPDAGAGVVEFSLPATALEGVVLEGRNYAQRTRAAYDIELYTAGDADVIRYLHGRAEISPEVTRPVTE